MMRSLYGLVRLPAVLLVLVLVLVAASGCIKTSDSIREQPTHTPAPTEEADVEDAEDAEETDAEDTDTEDTDTEDAEETDAEEPEDAEDAEETDAEETPVVTLEGFAVLPADTFADGPPAGAQIEGEYLGGRTAPFDSQPVQGVSAVLPGDDDTYLLMSDNGFGAKDNSADYNLRWYEAEVDFSSGSVEIVGYTELSDPDGHISWPITNEDEEDRILTGADFDLESFRKAPDGTFWLGEEFGPFLLHFDAEGKLLEPPMPTPYPEELEPFARERPFVQSPQNPDFFHLSDPEAAAEQANQPQSRGFEGMALNTSGTHLYPLLEGALVEQPDRTQLLIQEFSLDSGEYTGNYWFYPLADVSHAIGEMTAISDEEFLVIERDGNQGEEAEFKRIFKIALDAEGEGDVVEKQLVVDLMQITDSQGLTTPEEGAIGLGEDFSFPFVTIESVYPVDRETLLVINDNNYPFSSGRRPDVAPDNTEVILVGLPEPLW
jgi:glycerophosphoryl diester phosphodiesterase